MTLSSNALENTNLHLKSIRVHSLQQKTYKGLYAGSTFADFKSFFPALN
ncbi:MAG: hypothetical protein HN443_01060 [Flavobacteriaceae bacterium]|nr:hypothetical protein [Flavobacteriaceae bacterium]